MKTLLTLCLLLLLGCNDSPVPLGPAETALMNLKLAGVWEPLEQPENGGRESMQILPFNDHEFYIEYTSLPDGGKAPEVMRTRGFITPVGEATFANVQSIDLAIDDRDYLIFWFELTSDDLLNTILIDKNMDEVQSSEELLSLVQELIDTNALAEEERVQFRRRSFK